MPCGGGAQHAKVRRQDAREVVAAGVGWAAEVALLQRLGESSGAEKLEDLDRNKPNTSLVSAMN